MRDGNAILLYDGYCNLCGWLVRLVSRYDKNGRIELVPLQSERGSMLLLPCHLSEGIDSVVVITQHRCLIRSDAALMIFRLLGGGWKIIALLYVIPRFLRDPVYNLVARIRYRIFGSSNSCHLP